MKVAPLLLFPSFTGAPLEMLMKRKISMYHSAGLSWTQRVLRGFKHDYTGTSATGQPQPIFLLWLCIIITWQWQKISCWYQSQHQLGMYTHWIKILMLLWKLILTSCKHGVTWPGLLHFWIQKWLIWTGIMWTPVYTLENNDKHFLMAHVAFNRFWMVGPFRRKLSYLVAAIKVCKSFSFWC